jgi:arylsulfatase A-like enzyme
MQYQRQGRVDPVSRTPNLDRLADEGVFFTHVYSSNGQCVPSRVSMQTGLYPHESGVMTLYGFFGHTAHLGEEHRTVGQVFAEAGYTTAYFGKTHVGAQLEKVGYDRVVDRPQEYVRGQDAKDGVTSDHPQANSRVDREIVDAAINFVRDHDPDKPLFLTVSVNQPHPPFELVHAYEDLFPIDRVSLPPNYADDLASKPRFHGEHAHDNMHGAPDPELMREEIRRYYTMIASLDALFGDVRAAMEARGMWNDCAALFTSDHGDMLGSHGMRLKGTLAYEEVFRIPFVLKLPASSAPPVRTVVDNLGVNVSQPGTLLEAADLPVPSEFTGGSLLPAIYHSHRPETEAVFFEHYAAYWGIHPIRAVRARDADGGDWKLVKYFGPDTGELELYDLRADPGELRNVACDLNLAAVKSRLEHQVDDWWEATGGRDTDYYESEEFKNRGAATLFDERKMRPPQVTG